MILVAGEALMDMLPRPLAGGGESRLPVPGGSPFNVALALGRLGVPVRFLCRLSTDAFGERLAATLIESGVDLSWCPRTADLTTLGFVTFDPQAGTNRYAFYTEGTAGCGLRQEDLAPLTWEAIEALHIGSFSLAVEPFGSTIEALLPRKPERRPVFLDPNIRPFLIPDRERFLRRHGHMVKSATVIKLSLEDLEWLHPGSGAEETARAYLESGARLVVVTRGAEGALAFTRRGRAEAPPRPVEVVDTVGAGDTFQAALIGWLRERRCLADEAIDRLTAEDLRALLGFAAEAASINCSRAGCNPPRRSELPPSV